MEIDRETLEKIVTKLENKSIEEWIVTPNTHIKPNTSCSTTIDKYDIEIEEYPWKEPFEILDSYDNKLKENIQKYQLARYQLMIQINEKKDYMLLGFFEESVMPRDNLENPEINQICLRIHDLFERLKKKIDLKEWETKLGGEKEEMLKEQRRESYIADFKKIINN